jgi:hypothetical protein
MIPKSFSHRNLHWHGTSKDEESSLDNQETDQHPHEAHSSRAAEQQNWQHTDQ